MLQLYRDAMLRVLTGIPSFFYAIISTWFMVEVIAPKTGAPLAITSACFFIIGLVGYPAAAAKNAGRWPTDVFSLTLERFSLVLDYFLILMIIAAMLLISILLANTLFESHSFALSIVSGFVWGTSCLMLWCRLWPMINISFIYAGQSRWSASADGSIWYGPGFAAAWKMTQQPGLFMQATVPLSLAVFVLAGGYACIRFGGYLDGIALMILYCVFYIFILPFLFTLADTLAVRHKIDSKKSLNDHSESDFQEQPINGGKKSESKHALINCKNSNTFPAPEPFIQNIQPLYKIGSYSKHTQPIARCQQCRQINQKYWGLGDEPVFTKIWQPATNSLHYSPAIWTPDIQACTRCAMYWIYQYDQYDRYYYFYPFPAQFISYVDNNLSPQLIVKALLDPGFQRYFLFPCFQTFLDRGQYEKQQAIDFFATAAMQPSSNFERTLDFLLLIEQIVKTASRQPMTDEVIKPIQTMSDSELMDSFLELIDTCEEQQTNFSLPVIEHFNSHHVLPLFTLMEHKDLFTNMNPYQRGVARKQLGQLLNRLLQPSHRALVMNQQQRSHCYQCQSYEYRVARYCSYFDSVISNLKKADFSFIESAVVEITPDLEDTRSFSELKPYLTTLKALAENLKAKNMQPKLRQQSIGARKCLRSLIKILREN